MPIDPATLTRDIEPERTVLLFGAGSSIPSHAPSVERLQEHFERVFGVSAKGYSLAEQTGIIEQRTRDRARLISELRTQFTGVRPTGALLNLPLYSWKSIFTTNYDELIEAVYARRDRPLASYSSNFDFSIRQDSSAIQLFKLHGTISKDVAFGNNSRIILTEQDYDLTNEYRELLFDRLKGDLAGAHLIIIGHSLADEDIRAVVHRALSINSRAAIGGRITLFMYTRDEGRAELLEARGAGVCLVELMISLRGLRPE
jgi:SIR2-like domain